MTIVSHKNPAKFQQTFNHSLRLKEQAELFCKVIQAIFRAAKRTKDHWHDTHFLLFPAERNIYSSPMKQPPT